MFISLNMKPRIFDTYYFCYRCLTYLACMYLQLCIEDHFKEKWKINDHNLQFLFIWLAKCILIDRDEYFTNEYLKMQFYTQEPSLEEKWYKINGLIVGATLVLWSLILNLKLRMVLWYLTNIQIVLKYKSWVLIMS